MSARYASGRGVAAGAVDEVGECIVGDVGARQAEAEIEGDAAEDDQLPADVSFRVLVDHVLVAVHLRGVVEHGGEGDVLAGHGAAARVLDGVAGVEVLEVGVAIAQVTQIGVGASLLVGR